MWLQEVYQRLVNRPRALKQAWPQTGRRSGIRLGLEQLEDRTVPSTFNAATVSDLIADINAANQAGGSNTITLTAKSYNLAVVDNPTDGATGLPVIAANDNLTIVGNAATIARSTAMGTPAFRLLDVAGGASLALANLTLQDGLAYGAGVSAKGGAIYNQGTLDLNGVTMQNNIAHGQDGTGDSAAGGGIYSGGSLTMEGGTTIMNNQAIGGVGSVNRGRNVGPFGSPILQGGRGGDGAGGGLCMVAGTAAIIDAYFSSNAAVGGAGGYGCGGGSGGSGLGGGMYLGGGVVSLTNNILSSNSAQGGQGGAGVNQVAVFRGGPTRGGPGGNGFGAGLYVGGGTVTLRDDSVTKNAAVGGEGGSSRLQVGAVGLGEGGGIYIDAAATVYLDAFTVANVIHNKASTSNNGILGGYILTS